MEEILWCDHSNETSLAVLLRGAICFSFNILQNIIWDLFLNSGTLGSEGLTNMTYFQIKPFRLPTAPGYWHDVIMQGKKVKIKKG